jgi:microsomal dipeptidase-like Zn-dependent dipeptidase
VRARLGLAVAAAALAAAPADAAAQQLANRCVAIHPVEGRSLGTFHLKPTRLGAFMLYDGRLLVPGGRTDAPGPRAEWTLRRASDGTWVLRPGAGGVDQRVELVPRPRCRRFPEAEVGARGRPARGSLSGFADAHLHITADMRAGGRVIYGRAFHRFGIPAALGDDAREHGADGSLDVTGNLLRTGLPFGTHDTHGWPTFAGWPVHDTVTHQQTYWAWLERAWAAGLRLIVAQTVEDEPICRISPRRALPCDETRAIRGQVERLRQMQNYIDAQSGGRGRGWFRIVRSPRAARGTIRRGKLAVVIGVESSNLFGCSRRLGRPQCGRADVDRGLRRARRLGIRSVFVAHWVNNAFGGAALEGGARGTFINVFNRFQTGRWFTTERCPHPGQGEEVTTLGELELGVLSQLFPATAEIAAEGMPTYPSGRLCNTEGLTRLGRYLIRRLMDHGMLIDVDHLSEKARETVLAIAARRRYPLVSSHNGTGGSWTPAQLRRLYASGGFAAAQAGTAPELAAQIVRLAGHRRGVGVGLGSDTGGFAELPGPRQGGRLRYPFRSQDGRVVFTRQRTGERTFDLNRDGVAHYGLFADLIADMRQSGGRRALRQLFGSAEAFVRTWQRAERVR